MQMLICRTCDRTYPTGPAEPWRCRCGGPLDFADPPELVGPPPTFETIDTRRGLWAFADALPGPPKVTLGEGCTPMVEAPDWDATFKLEYLFPSGSFKDRGATTTVSRAVDLGATHVVEDSSGNAGAAIALYAARAGIDATVYVPAAVTRWKLQAIRRTGASIVQIEGDRAAVSEACMERVENGAAYYASHAWNPAFLEGTKTFAFEVCAHRDWTAPDAVVIPLGHGTLVLGAYRGFSALQAAGWIDDCPRLLCAQATGAAPIAAALHGRTVDQGDNPLADGIQIAAPVRTGAIRAAISATDGDAIAIDEKATAAALDRLHADGFFVEPTSAVAPAALEAYRHRGVIQPTDDVVVPLTGSGLKG